MQIDYVIQPCVKRLLLVIAGFSKYLSLQFPSAVTVDQLTITLRAQDFYEVIVDEGEAPILTITSEIESE